MYWFDILVLYRMVLLSSTLTLQLVLSSVSGQDLLQRLSLVSLAVTNLQLVFACTDHAHA